MVMVLVFALTLHYTKTSIFSVTSSIVQTIASGGIIDSSIITSTSEQIDHINTAVLLGMVAFSAITGIVAAHITLIPTRDEFAQRKKFITAVAHELRTPLAVLRTSNEVALYDLSNKQETEEVLKSNIEETKHMANILNNLIVFSRVGASESLSFEETHLSQLIEAASKKLEAFAHTRNVKVHYVSSELPSILANATALEQIFYNLIKNAIIYSKKDGGLVTITSSVNPGYAVVTIADTGIGISQKNLRHIFEPFFRINRDDAQSQSGTGLGLSLVFEIMKLHKGIMTVESKEAIGTTFTLQFPLAALPFTAKPVSSSPDSVSFSFEK